MKIEPQDTKTKNELWSFDIRDSHWLFVYVLFVPSHWKLYIVHAHNLPTHSNRLATLYYYAAMLQCLMHPSLFVCFKRRWDTRMNIQFLKLLSNPLWYLATIRLKRALNDMHHTLSIYDALCNSLFFLAFSLQIVTRNEFI